MNTYTIFENWRKYLNEGLDKHLYIRFGDIPPNEISADHTVGGTERGVSVYKAVPKENGKGWRVVFPNANKARWDYSSDESYIRDMLNGLFTDRILEGAIFLVTGTLIKPTGADGEPLLKNIQVIRKLSPDQVYIGDTVYAKTYDSVNGKIVAGPVKLVDRSVPMADYLKTSEKDEDPILRLKRERVIEKWESGKLDKLGISISDEVYEDIFNEKPGTEKVVEYIWKQLQNIKIKQKGKVSPINF